MFFNSITFLYFFIIVFSLYLLLKNSVKYQNILLLIASYFFYGFWNWKFTSLLLFSSILDFYCGKNIYNTKNQKHKKLFLLLSAAGNLGVLGFFKYYNFFADSFVSFLSIFGFKINPFTLNIILPVGISFYTFQTLAYTFDIYKNKIKPENKFLNFALYVSFYPQLVAGPIERPTHLLGQIDNKRKITIDKISSGFNLVIIGLFKKIAIADFLAYSVVENVFSNPSAQNPFMLWIGVYSFALQIYGDFSGYSDIARGVSRIMGFELMENFNQPYLSTNITDFWRRWHISLSSWLKDYLYITLGGNRKGKKRTYINLMLTMLLGGLWHGANWTFVVWGGLHGLFLATHKLMLRGKKAVHKIEFKSISIFKNLIKIFLTFNLVCVTWIFFRAKTFTIAKIYILKMIQFNKFNFDIPLFFIYGVIAVLFCDIPQYITQNHDIMNKWNPILKNIIIAFMIFLLFILQPPKNVPFIYFQF